MQMNLKATRNVWGQDLCHKTSATPLPLIPSMDTVSYNTCLYQAWTLCRIIRVYTKHGHCVV